MKREIRTVAYDGALCIEAYRLQGVARPFPNHFHEHYVIGLVEDGARRLHCKGREHDIGPETILLFNPGDNHGCAQLGGGALDYRGLNIGRDAMLRLAEEVSGRRELPRFSRNVLRDGEIACHLRSLHEMVMGGAEDLGREETLLLLISALMRRCARPFDPEELECRLEIERACAFIEGHYAERIRLDQLCDCAGISKSTLLRAFARAKGITPYRYLENVRVNEAKALLRRGATPLEAAMRTGFSDQSHFTNYFIRFIGLAPGAYREIFLRKETNENHGI